MKNLCFFASANNRQSAVCRGLLALATLVVFLTSSTKAANVHELKLTDTHADSSGTNWLTHLTAKCIRHQIMVSWTAPIGPDTVAFEVQRSTDGRTFSPMAITPAQASPNRQLTQYGVLDHAPLEGQNYYRIKRITVKGTSSLSNMVALKWNPDLGRLIGSPYPNPAVDAVSLPDFAGTLAYRVWDSSSTLVLSGEGSAGTRLDLYGLPDGLYQLEMNTGPERILRKFVKQTTF